MKLLLRVEVTGLHHVPLTGPLLIIINHIAFLDPVLVCGAWPRPVTPMAKKEALDLFFFGLFVKIYGTIPVHRGEADLQAIKSALQLLKQGEAVLVAPEGTRSPTYQLQSGKGGAVMLALHSGATLIPAGITGAHQIKAHWLKLKRPPIRLAIGPPFRLHPTSPTGRVPRAELTAMTHEAMFRLAAQLPAEFRGVYSNLEEATSS
jgi:1-acyl-sn-glycerol-3-phosphate acyltransferase